jgi:hypothetical protein
MGRLQRFRCSREQTRHDLYSSPMDKRDRLLPLDAVIRSYTVNRGVPELYAGQLGPIQTGHRVEIGDPPWSVTLAQPPDPSNAILFTEFAGANKLEPVAK